jgi:hypothetical protein
MGMYLHPVATRATTRMETKPKAKNVSRGDIDLSKFFRLGRRTAYGKKDE